MKSEQIIIIGGGPAGCACAIQLKRYGFDPLIIEKDSIGGLAKNAGVIFGHFNEKALGSSFVSSKGDMVFNSWNYISNMFLHRPSFLPKIRKGYSFEDIFKN